MPQTDKQDVKEREVMQNMHNNNYVLEFQNQMISNNHNEKYFCNMLFKVCFIKHIIKECKAQYMP